MEAMREMIDNEFDLAIVDPEFGIGISRSPRLVADKGLSPKEWDDKPIDMNYFTELYRISKDQIIWGGNYYALPSNKHCVIWDKIQPEDLSFGMFDYAWTSFKKPNKIFRYSVRNKSYKIHPTQKPVALYKWLLKNYAKEGDSILDTHAGSMSSVIACLDMGFEMTAFEIDKDYFNAAKKRVETHLLQPNLFQEKPEIVFKNEYR